jgi:hypothetical protein
MIKTILTVLSIALLVPASVLVCGASSKAPRTDSAMGQLQDVWLTQAQAQKLLVSVDMLIAQVQELSKQNRAPRPGAVPCDAAFPGCQACDLAPVLDCLCALKLQLCCICEEIQSLTDGFGSCCEVIGNCDDLSEELGSVVTKAEIDALCLSVVSLLKTVLLELRGGFNP